MTSPEPDESGAGWVASAGEWISLALTVYVVLAYLRPGPAGPRLWHAAMVCCQTVAAAFGRAAIAAEMSYRAAVDRASLAD